MTEKQLLFLNQLLQQAHTVALLTFGLTVEPTASFWDAGEYIATSAKLQGHHQSLFQMMGASSPSLVLSRENSLMVNLMSVFSSAFTVLFLTFSRFIIA